MGVVGGDGSCRRRGLRLRRGAAGLLIAATTLGAAARVSAQTPPPEPPYKFSGLVFGDYYYFSQDHDPAWEGQDGFWFRRIYFTFDYTFTPRITTRLRLEMNSNGSLAQTSLTPYVKDAYLRWTFYGRQQLTLGMQPTISIDAVESLWGLRHVEKTPLDLYRWESSRDTGVGAEGPLNASGTLKYRAQFGNDSGSNSETDRFKGGRVAMHYERASGLVADGMYAYSKRENHTDRSTCQALAGFRATRGRVGFLYAHEKRRAGDGGAAEDLLLDIYSGFGAFDLKPRKFSLFARVDRFNDPCPECASIDYLPIDTTAKFTLVLAGAEYFLLPSVRFSPNVEWVTYGAPTDPAVARPKDDIVWRATFYWAW